MFSTGQYENMDIGCTVLSSSKSWPLSASVINNALMRPNICLVLVAKVHVPSPVLPFSSPEGNYSRALFHVPLYLSLLYTHIYKKYAYILFAPLPHTCTHSHTLSHTCTRSSTHKQQTQKFSHLPPCLMCAHIHTISLSHTHMQVYI